MRALQPTWLCAALGALGCGPSMQTLVARGQMTEACAPTRVEPERAQVLAALYPRIEVRAGVRVYSVEELTTLLGWVPSRLRDGSVVLVASRVDVNSPLVTSQRTELYLAASGGAPAVNMPCCADEERWLALDGRGFARATGPVESPWSLLARGLLGAMAIPLQTALGTLRDVTTVATAGLVPNTPIEGPGFDFSVGAIIARWRAAPAATAPQPAPLDDHQQSRARLDAIIGSACDPARDPSCLHYEFFDLGASGGADALSFALHLATPDGALSCGTLLLELPLPPGPNVSARVRTQFPNGLRSLRELPVRVHD